MLRNELGRKDLRIEIVLRQREDGPLKQRLFMNAGRLHVWSAVSVSKGGQPVGEVGLLRLRQDRSSACSRTRSPVVVGGKTNDHVFQDCGGRTSSIVERLRLASSVVQCKHTCLCDHPRPDAIFPNATDEDGPDIVEVSGFCSGDSLLSVTGSASHRQRLMRRRACDNTPLVQQGWRLTKQRGDLPHGNWRRSQ